MDYAIFTAGFVLCVVGLAMNYHRYRIGADDVKEIALSTSADVTSIKSDISFITERINRQDKQFGEWSDRWIEAQKNLSNRCYALDEKLDQKTCELSDSLKKQDEIFTSVWKGIDSSERRLRLDIDLLKQKAKPQEPEKMQIDLLVYDGDAAKAAEKKRIAAEAKKLNVKKLEVAK